MNKEYEKIFTERGFTNIEQMATMFDFYKNELDKYKNIVDKAITFINVFQDEKSLTLNYNDLKHLRSILKGDEFGLRILEDKLKELRGFENE